jgi:putative sterol carrier protein
VVRVQYVIGDDKHVATLADGRVTDVVAGEDKDAEVTVTLAPADFAKLAGGELDASVAYMQGKLKATGDTGILIELLAASRAPEYRALLAKVSPAGP